MGLGTCALYQGHAKVQQSSYCVGYRQRALPDDMIIWEQTLSVQYTVQAVNVFVTLVSDNYCILRNHLAIIQLVSLFQPLSADNIM